MTAASPGVISLFFRNDHYPNHEAYLFAIAEAMRHEYEAIAAAGFVLQVDCPDLAMGRHIQFADLELGGVPQGGARCTSRRSTTRWPASRPSRLRMHLCWGNYEGPHHYDVPLADIIDLVFTARADGISFEAANPRHAHEWRVFERVKLPEGKVLIPGVLDSTTNFIEHPELVAERIGRYAQLVGRENVIAGTDCGFGTWVGQAAVDPGHRVGEARQHGRGRAAGDEGVLEVASVDELQDVSYETIRGLRCSVDENDIVAELFETANVVTTEPRGVAPFEVVSAEVVVDDAVLEHVPQGDDHSVLHGDDGFLGAASRFQPMVEGAVVTLLRADGRPGDLLQCRA